MEREELDQIPWSQLAVDVDHGVDRRWYGVGIAVGVIVVVVLGFRLLSGSGGQPIPPPSAAAPPAPTTAPAVTDATTSTTRPITEADLRAAAPPAEASDPMTSLIAEWFITDWYTLDGARETAAAVRARLAPDETAIDIPHEGIVSEPTFVEWARAFATEDQGDVARVSVAFRRIRTVDGVFVRDPVTAAIVDVVRIGDRWAVSGPPTPTEVP